MYLGVLSVQGATMNVDDQKNPTWKVLSYAFLCHSLKTSNPTLSALNNDSYMYFALVSSRLINDRNHTDKKCHTRRRIGSGD